MKSYSRSGLMLTVGLLNVLPSFAQVNVMRPPMVPQAIDMQMQQRRTLEQREAFETHQANLSETPQASNKKTSVKKSKAIAKPTPKVESQN